MSGHFETPCLSSLSQANSTFSCNELSCLWQYSVKIQTVVWLLTSRVTTVVGCRRISCPGMRQFLDRKVSRVGFFSWSNIKIYYNSIRLDLQSFESNCSPHYRPEILIWCFSDLPNTVQFLLKKIGNSFTVFPSTTVIHLPLCSWDDAWGKSFTLPPQTNVRI